MYCLLWDLCKDFSGTFDEYIEDSLTASAVLQEVRGHCWVAVEYVGTEHATQIGDGHQIGLCMLRNPKRHFTDEGQECRIFCRK